MKKKNLKSTMLCLALSLSLVTGMTFASLAGTGNISFSGMSTSWSLSSIRMHTTITNSSTASLEVSGKIHEYSNSANHHYMKSCSGSSSSCTKLSFDDYPDISYLFENSTATQYHSYMKIYINGNLITTYYPTV